MRATIAALVALSAGGAQADDRARPAPPAQSDVWNQRNIGTAIAVGGAVIDLAALLVGADAMSQRDEARDAGCRDDLTHCPANALPTAESAYRAANRATVMVAVGSLAIGAGIYLRLTAPRAHAVSLSPTIGPDAAGATLFGRF